MSRIYYSYRNWTDSQGNNYSIGGQTQNYPELFSPLKGGMKPVASISEGFISEEKYRGGDRFGFVEIDDKLLTLLPIDLNYIQRTLERIGSILNLDVIEDPKAWIARYTTLEEQEEGYFISESFGIPFFLKI